MLKQISFLVWIVTAAACSHMPASNTGSENASQDWSQTSVDIRYTLHNSDRRLTLEADAQGVHGKSLVDGSQLKQCQIDAIHYREFIAKVRNFTNQRRTIASTPSPAATVDCRAPYTIILKNQKDTVQVQGCRTQDEGAFSHLVQDGEFLIYRQK